MSQEKINYYLTGDVYKTSHRLLVRRKQHKLDNKQEQKFSKITFHKKE